MESMAGELATKPIEDVSMEGVDEDGKAEALEASSTAHSL